MHRRPLPTGCKTRPTATDSCPRTNGRGQTLTQLIADYKRNYGDRQRARREPYRDFANLTEAIRYATGSIGKVPDHQRRVGRRILTQASNRLLRNQAQIEACESFDELLNRIEQQTADIRRFGSLAAYDTAWRLGMYLGLAPERVYLHAGTAKGAKALGLTTPRRYLEMHELPKPFRRLEPWECEDFLCIYKTSLAELKRRS